MEAFGRYELIKKIATGGMAEIFLARQAGIEGFEKLLVLKRILPHLAENEEFVEMFLHEARVAVRLNHPNIVQIYDLGEEGGAYFIAMEYIHGEDARRIWRTCEKAGMNLPIPLACRIAMDAAAGLAYAHKRCDAAGRPLNIIHRDISPQNLLVSFEGSVKVVDFGIAKAADQATQTRSGVLKGKYSYMSPEQASGLDIDQRTDQFALGIVLHELLTFQRLFKRSNEIQTLTAVADCQVPRPSSLNSNVAPELDAIVMKALAKNPDDRFANLQEFQLALEEWLVTTRQPSSNALLSTFLKSLYADRLAQEAREELPFERELSNGSDSIISKRIQRRRSSVMAAPPRTSLASKSGVRSRPKPSLPPPQPVSGVRSEPSRPSAETPSRPKRRRNTAEMAAAPRKRSGQSQVSGRLDLERAEVAARPKKRWLAWVGVAIGISVAACLVAGVAQQLAASGGDLLSLLPKPDLAALPPPPSLPTSVEGAGQTAPAAPSVAGQSQAPAERHQLSPAPAADKIQLTILTEPAGATVHFNGRMLPGVTPLTQAMPRVKEATIRVSAPGYQDRVEEVLLTDGTLQQFKFVLQRRGGASAMARPQPQPPRPASVSTERRPATADIEAAGSGASGGTGTVSVKSIPVARVWEGRTALCEETPCEIELPAGKHKIVLSNPAEGFETARTFTLRKGQKLSFEIEMEKGELLVLAKPWADVWLRSKKLGTTPMPKVSLYEGAYQLTLINADLGKKKTVMVDVAPNALTKVSVDMSAP